MRVFNLASVFPAHQSSLLQMTEQNHTEVPAPEADSGTCISIYPGTCLSAPRDRAGDSTLLCTSLLLAKEKDT